MSIPRCPPGSGPVGGRLWKDVLSEFDLAGHELIVLRQAVRSADRCEELAAVLKRDGLTVPTAHGAPKLNPVASELRSAELGLVRLLVCLHIPLGGVRGSDDGDQYRGLRGVYSMGGAA
jgi:hypothetical protein